MEATWAFFVGLRGCPTYNQVDKHKRRYSPEFRNAALDELESGTPGARVAEAFDVDLTTLYLWYRKSGRKTEGIIPVRREHDEAFKRKAVKRLEEGQSIRSLARESGVARQTLRRWFEKFKKGSSALLDYKGSAEAKRGKNKLRAAEAKDERLRKKRMEAEREEKERLKHMVADPLIWMQQYTKTKDSHWREAGAESPYRPFPDKPHFRPLTEGFKKKPTIFVEKSRDMMCSWLFVGLFTHAAMTTPGIEVLFQSQKEDKACELVDYAKTLYEHSDELIRKAYPLKGKIQAADTLEFANGSRIVGIPGGGDQIRSYHPWGLLMDEAAFMPEAGESFDNAVSVCEKIVVVSSAGPGWFAEVCSGEAVISS